ncbi:MAG: hypothetical protein A2W93_05745 [Bacteroidetes bacterium GWF2_43_63]|nr:MAG: hypothetical protein A2W94_07320 [Bacteroidetes bacterium GWE2_42_42]OFY55516.1 MAG: hypothetical protein A2W93_05745 [Bacteroidetes bacterium GWF2_43_63]HBG69997.1 hypothetical protein [Bacteroidales bacterium]HCB62578.1 hypothetical protein [Bacteroidales bacterium]HCY23698.1 hypothetical protein [Bacteroidales bacterium]
MKHNIVFFISLILLSLSACTQTSVNYSIKRTDYVKGSYKNFEWILQNDSVKVIEYPMSSDPDSVRCYAALTNHQVNKLQNLLKDIDLSKLESNYTNDSVQGEGHSVYDISINGSSKHIYVYYVDVPELQMIDAFLFDVTADCIF